MLARFEVENFKSFQKRLVLDLEKRSNYEFNSDLVKYDVIRAGIIFGENASGKSNLGLAVFDLINHLTDKERGIAKYQYYLNLNSNEKFAEFKYVFKFNDSYLEYSYRKDNPTNLLNEIIKINGKTVVEYDFKAHKGICLLKGAENLNKNLEDTNISFVKYIHSNTILADDEINLVFKQFMLFVNNMLLFYSLEGNHYQGFSTERESLGEGIIKRGKLKEFNKFLNEMGIKCNLVAKNIDDKMQIYSKFNHEEVNFFSIASTGTKSLALFFYWLIQMDHMSLVFMDEFDAYYHFDLSYKVVEYVIKNMNLQVLFTSHNTNLMTNELLRPDCYFNLKNNSIKSFANLTEKELRKAHNLQKMYKAGAFDE
ncbi:MAG: ATP-binding protein [Erysipelotrichaceae bacterium]